MVRLFAACNWIVCTTPVISDLYQVVLNCLIFSTAYINTTKHKHKCMHTHLQYTLPPKKGLPGSLMLKPANWMG